MREPLTKSQPKYDIGQMVQVTNGNGVNIGNKTIIDINFEGNYHLHPTDTPWFAWKEDSLRLIDPIMEVGDTVLVIDSELGEVSGMIESFNHEGYPIVKFDTSTVVVFPDMVTKIIKRIVPVVNVYGVYKKSSGAPRPVWEQRP